MKQCSAKYVLGLTATPRRKDLLEVLLYQQCGPIRDEIKIREGQDVSKLARIRETGFRLPEALGPNPPYHMIAHLLATDTARNELIASDIAAALRRGRFPLVLADRKAQIKALEAALKEAALETGACIYCFDGHLSTMQRREMLSAVTKTRQEGRLAALMSTASLIG
jgi:superfamily II DNA or RNA helicase